MKILLMQLVLVGAALCSPRLDPLVETSKGLIRGLQASDGDYAMFLGIPYARVNGSNPFGESQPFPKFDDVFEAYHDVVKCPHVSSLTAEIVGSIDCLQLNVFVPNKATTRNRLPVLVYIHGGIFQVGHSSPSVFGPKFLVEKEVVLVTINYRVGVYGFMCLDTEDVPGNQGLKDQLIALRWVKENIGAFGGDPNKVTISGQSAGGVSVDFHLLVDEEKLFDKAIMQSGTTPCPWVVAEKDMEAPIKLAKQLGLDSKDNDEALAYLATVQPELIIAAVGELSMTFLPCVEKEFQGVERFLKEYPIDNPQPRVKDIPILAGYTSNEMLFYIQKPGKTYPGIFSENLELSFNLDEGGEMEKIVRQYYIGDESPSVDLLSELELFESDFTFNHPVHRSMNNFLTIGAKVYHYLFSYSGARNYGKVRVNMTQEGVAHSDDLGYLYDISFLFKEDPTAEDKLTIDRMTTMWTNFVKYGDPTPETTELLPVKWLPITSEALYYLDIGSNLHLKKRPYHDRMAFWDLFFEMYKNSRKRYNDID